MIQKLKELYNKLNIIQKITFNKLYGSIDTIETEKINDAIIFCKTPVFTNINIVNTAISKPTIPKLRNCLCGNIPVKDEIFYYQSKYNKEPIEGIVDSIYDGSIRSKNGTSYGFNEIFIKTKSQIREEKINEILKK